MGCSAYFGLPYPGNPSCDATLEDQLSDFSALYTAVSSNFDPAIFSQYQTAQYYSYTKIKHFEPKTRDADTFAITTMTASQSLNTYSGHFFWPFADKQLVNTTAIAY